MPISFSDNKYVLFPYNSIDEKISFLAFWFFENSLVAVVYFSLVNCSCSQAEFCRVSAVALLNL